MKYHVSPNNGGLLHGRTQGASSRAHGFDGPFVDHAFVVDDVRALGVGDARPVVGENGDVCVLCGGSVPALLNQGEKK